NDRGQPLASFPLVLGRELARPVTISRADLHEGLVSLLSDVDVRFNTTVTHITQKEHSVEITFNSGKKDSFDLVVGADGVHSAIRTKVFGKHFLKYYGWCAWAYWLPHTFDYPAQPTGFLGNGKTIFILPSHASSTATFIARISPGSGFQRADRRAQLQEMFSEFSGLGAQAMKQAPESTAIWHDDIAYVRMPVWHKGRIVLIG